jgi:hypothetical protein
MHVDRVIQVGMHVDGQAGPEVPRATFHLQRVHALVCRAVAGPQPQQPPGLGL